MDFDLREYWQQILALLALSAGWAKIKTRQDQTASELADLRREVDRLRDQAQGQAVMLVAINESLSAIKTTLDRLYERVDRRA